MSFLLEKLHYNHLNFCDTTGTSSYISGVVIFSLLLLNTGVLAAFA